MIYGPYTARQNQSVPPEYTYSTPEAKDVAYEGGSPFAGLSFEEISDGWGTDTAQAVYDTAALGGGDLTCPGITTEPSRKRVFDWYAVAYADRVAFFLRANRYTSARKDLCVGAFSVDSTFIGIDRLQDLFAVALSRLSRAPIGR